MHSTVTLHPVSDVAAARDLLERNDLPTADLQASDVDLFEARADGDRVGVGGIERYGTDALLRSVAVDSAVRGQGYGTALCDALEGRADESGVDSLYLLTTTAAEFFAARGYEEVPRAAVPAAVRNSAEFDDLCPDAATCMRRSL